MADSYTKKESAKYETLKVSFETLAQKSNKTVLHEEYAELQKLVADLNSFVPRESVEEVSITLDCLAQSSVSPDSFRQLETLVDTMAQNSMSPDLINNQFVELSNRILDIKTKYDDIHIFCDKIMSIMNTIPDLDKKIATYSNSMYKILKENENFQQLISEQIRLMMQSFATLHVKVPKQDRHSLLQLFKPLLINSEDLQDDPNHELIGEGGVCYVYSVQHKQFGKVALKRLKEDFLVVPLMHDNMMRREARCLKMLSHPNIVQFVGLVWEPNYHAIVMEYMINKDLQTFVAKHRLHLHVKAKLLRDTAQGVSYLHWLPKRIIHNDLKAANILISNDIVAKISDFGLADWTSFTTELFYKNREKSRGATHTHRSPESWLNFNESSCKSDVYSFGILMWEVFSEKTPFANSSAEVIGFSVLRGQRPDVQLLLKEIPKELITLMENCWHQEQEKRPTMATVLADFQELLSRQDIKNTLVAEISELFKPPSTEINKNENISVLTDDTKQIKQTFANNSVCTNSSDRILYLDFSAKTRPFEKINLQANIDPGEEKLMQERYNTNKDDKEIISETNSNAVEIMSKFLSNSCRFPQVDYLSPDQNKLQTARQKMDAIKITLVGDGAVGKTCFLLAYINRTMPKIFVPTVFETYATTVLIGNRLCSLSLWDTAGQEDYDRLRPLSYPLTDVFLVFCSVEYFYMYRSYDEYFKARNDLKGKWLTEISQFCPKVPYLLVGNKSDLRKTYSDSPITNGEKLAKEMKALKYLECSSLTGDGLDNVIDEAVLTVLNSREMKKKRFCSIF